LGLEIGAGPETHTGRIEPGPTPIKVQFLSAGAKFLFGKHGVVIERRQPIQRTHRLFKVPQFLEIERVLRISKIVCPLEGIESVSIRCPPLAVHVNAVSAIPGAANSNEEEKVQNPFLHNRPLATFPL
jgi:hypothetical protein